MSHRGFRASSAGFTAELGLRAKDFGFRVSAVFGLRVEG